VHELLARALPPPLPGKDDLAAALAGFPLARPVGQVEDWQAVHVQRLVRDEPVEFTWGGQAITEGRTCRLWLGVGGVRSEVFDAARREQLAARELDRRLKVAALRAALRAAGDVDALDALDHPRGRAIVAWSRKSRARMVETFANLDHAPMREHEDRVAGMVTLTYPCHWEAAAPDGATAKRHLRAFIERWSRAFGRPPGLWKLEFQGRGAPHFHLHVPVPALAPSPFCAEDHGEDSCSCWTFEEWVSWTWADVVDVAPVGDCDCRAKHLRAGTGVDFAAAAGFSDPKRLAVYFLGHGLKHRDGKEYQHQVPAIWREPGRGPGRFWGYWRLSRAVVAVDLDLDDHTAAMRVLRGVLRARARTTAYQRARGQSLAAGWGSATATRDGIAAPYRVPRTLGASGRLTGGFVLVNDGVQLAFDLARWLTRLRPPP